MRKAFEVIKKEVERKLVPREGVVAMMRRRRERAGREWELRRRGLVGCLDLAEKGGGTQHKARMGISFPS